MPARLEQNVIWRMILPTSCRGWRQCPTIRQKESVLFTSAAGAQAMRHRFGQALHSQDMIAGGFIAVFRQIGQRHDRGLVGSFQLLVEIQIVQRCGNPVAEYVEQIF